MPDLFDSSKNLQPQDKEESAAPENLFTEENIPPQEKHIAGKSFPIPHKRCNPHLFTSYCENPNNIRFAEAEPDEKILLFLRRHFVTNIPWIFITALLLIAPFIFRLIINVSNIEIGFLPPHSNVFLVLFYYLLVFAYALVSFFTWFYNISLITQRRVVDIDFSDLIYKNVAATKIDLVQDASYSQIGVIRSVFDYGDVLVQTAGSLDNFDFQAAPHPEKVIQILEKIIGKENENV